MKLWRWNTGRQNTGYDAFPFFITKFCDAYILRYKTGDWIPTHVDKVTDRKHYRCNIILSFPVGGIFHCEKMILNTKYVKIFRPDLYEHGVTIVQSGTRYVLSLGLALRTRSSVG